MHWIQILLILLPFNYSTLATALDIGDLFQIMGDESRGGCYPRITALSTYVEDSRALLQAALNAINRYQSDDVVRRTIAAFFGIPDDPTRPVGDDSLNNLRNWYTTVEDFFLTGDYPNRRAKPRLYCDSTWMERRNINTDRGHGPGGELLAVTVGESDLFRQALRDEGFATVEPWMWAYWSHDLKIYLVEPFYPETKCMSMTDLAETLELPGISVVTLCPRSFRSGTARLGTTVPIDGAALSLMQSRVLTFLHEVFHLTLGGCNSPDNGIYAAQQCIAAARRPENHALTAPECYTLFAEAMWYGDNAAKFNGQRFEFSSGYARIV